jgi:ABC-2 type transport system permease protein
MKRFLAQAGTEVGMTLRRGESLLLTIGIPAVLLVFLAKIQVFHTTGKPLTTLAPGVLSLAIMGTAMANLSLSTGFERGYGVLKRLRTTPLGRPALLAAKITAVLVVELLQVVVLVPVAVALGWRANAGGVGIAVAVTLLATAAFGGIGLLLAGVVKAEVNLATANGLWFVFLLLGGSVVPLSDLHGWLHGVATLLPAAALSEALYHSLGLRSTVPTWAWANLVVWAVVSPVAAALTFRWE